MEALFVIDKELKGSRRYKCKNDKFPITNVYVNRDYSDGLSEITIRLVDTELEGRNR